MQYSEQREILSSQCHGTTRSINEEASASLHGIQTYITKQALRRYNTSSSFILEMARSFLLTVAAVFLTLCTFFHYSQSSAIPENEHARLLQVMERFQIGESRITFAGTLIELIFPLNDLVPDGSVSTTIFSDDQCSVDIEGNDYLMPSIEYDDNPNPDGTKNRLVTIRYDVDPIKIQDSAVWRQDETNQFFMFFCMGLRLHEGDAETTRISSSIETVVKLQVDLMGDFGVELPVDITDPAAFSAAQKYFVNGYICDDNLEQILYMQPFRQGERIRVCVVPEDVALDDGIYMRRIDSFTYMREKPTDGSTIFQKAILDGVSANPALTELTCERGTEVCFFDTLLRSDFFFGRGEVYGFGEAWLQYGRGIVRKLEFSVRNPEYPVRKLQEVDGGFAGASGVNVELLVAPDESELKFGALAYECDQFNRKIKNPEPKRLGSSVRICVTPDQPAMDYRMTINRIDSFNWTRSDVGASQTSVAAGGSHPEDGRSIIVCVADSKLCIFRTQYTNDFYESSDGIVKGVGKVVMQYGPIREIDNGGLAFSRRNLARRRDLQLSPLPENRVVGSVPVSVEVDVLRLENKDLPEHCQYDHKVTSWWTEGDPGKQYMWIGVALASLAALCCPLLVCLFCPCCRRDEDEEIIEEEDHGDIKINVNLSNEKEENLISKSSSHRSLDTAEGSDSSKEVRKTRRSDSKRSLSVGDEGPGKHDVCFEDLTHPGTKKLIKAIRRYQSDDPDEKFGPHSYRVIKKDLGDHVSYYTLDKKGRYVESSKKQSIPLMGDLYEQIKNGTLPRSRSNQSLEDLERGSSRRTVSTTKSSKSMKRSSSTKSLS